MVLKFKTEKVTSEKVLRLILHFCDVSSPLVDLCVKTSSKRRTISLQPPFEGQQIRIFVFLFGGTDDDTVGD